MSTMDINTLDDVDTWAERYASIAELRRMLNACERVLRTRSYLCQECGREIPTALPRKHPKHLLACSRYASMITY